MNQLISALLQVGLLMAIPFLYYVCSRRAFCGFFSWIGLKIGKGLPLKWMFILFTAIGLGVFIPYLWLYQTGCLTYSGFVVDSFLESGWSVQNILILVLWACIQTALSEEIFFRGFLLELFGQWINWGWANLLQATIFGLIHCFSVLNQSIGPIFLVVGLTAGIGWTLGWLKKTKSDGSLFAGILIHAGANLLSTVLVFCFLL